MDSKIENWKTDLEHLCESLKGSKSIDLAIMNELEHQIMKISTYLKSNHENLEVEALKKMQSNFRSYTNDIYSKSYFFRRARTWPKGYPGDHETLEKIYGGVPVEKEGIGMYLDNYFITRALASGVRERKRLLSNLIAYELEQRPEGQKILNIACGSSREIFDIGKKMNTYKAKITFLDYDQDAVDYSKLLLANEGINVADYEFMKFNALKLASPEVTESTFGKKDIIYSAGLFDYIRTDVLKKMLVSLFNLLEPNGVLIAPFKDKENYNTYDYHWLVDWSYFFQRTIGEVKGILEDATKAEVELIKSESAAINFFIIRKK